MKKIDNFDWLLFRIGICLAFGITTLIHELLVHSFLPTLVASLFLSLFIGIGGCALLSYLRENRRYDMVYLPLVYGVIVLGLVLMIFGDKIPYGYLWLIPSVFVALVVGFEYSYVLFLGLLFQNIIFQSNNIDVIAIIISFLYGSLVCFLLSHRVSKKMLPYIFLTMLSVECLFVILKYRFIFSAIVADKINVIVELASVLVLEIFVYVHLLLARKGGRFFNEEMKQLHLEKRVFGLLEADYSLLLKLQEFSGSVFVHSMRISRVSAEAADCINANVIMAQAGGMYHEIGRLTGDKNYIEAGAKLLEEKRFPKQIVKIVREHQGVDAKPTSPEACIVMMAESILTTYDYLEKKGQVGKLSNKQLVDKVFYNKMKKGYFEQCDMTIKQIDRLRKYFINEVLPDPEQDIEEDEEEFEELEG